MKKIRKAVFDWCFSSEDFKAGELVTHSQSCKWRVEFSDLGDVLLSKDSRGEAMDPHADLAATVLGVSYDEFITNKKLRRFSDTRQASKPENFGKPGGMGDPKLVLQQRKQGPDTPHHTGPNFIKDEEGNLVPGYKGLRFCILMGGEGPCGRRKISEWNDRMYSPMCVECLERAVELGSYWKKRWRESKPYFDLVKKCVDHGQVITWEMLQRWPWLQEYYQAGQRLAPGETMHHWSGRVRGGLSFTEAANGWFQGLLVEITKLAYCRVTRECYDRTVRVPGMLYENSILSKYEGSYSPLYGSRAPGFFHDEIFATHPTSVGSDAAWRISEIMRDCMRYVCPDYADAAIVDPTLMYAWAKDASKVVHGGRLVPWTPEHNPKTCAECLH